jgi:hypothetical protein
MTTAGRKLYEKLINIGIRIFCIQLKHGDSSEMQYWMHSNKTTQEWRQDLRTFSNREVSSEEGWAHTVCEGNVEDYLQGLGYVLMVDVISDIYEGRIAIEKSRLTDCPRNRNQSDGFGCFGWESEPIAMKESYK